MTRVLTLLLVGLVSLGLVGVLVWNLSFSDTSPPATVTVEGLSTSVRLAHSDAGTIHIEGATEADAATALGFAHGWYHTWSVVLWRQAALGQLGQWFGTPALPIDRLAHTLGLASGARAAYATLPADDRAWIDAYGRGMAKALSHQTPQLRQELVLLEVTPSSWEPWHALAIERLVGWLSTTLTDSSASHYASSTLDTLRQADASLRSWLQLYGFEHSLAWAVRDTAATHLTARYTYGGSTLPLLVATQMQWTDGPQINGVSIPGTPFWPMGQTARWAWVNLLYAPGSLHWRPYPERPETRHHRILLSDGAEHLVTSQHGHASLLFADTRSIPVEQDTASAVNDTVLTLSWTGFTHGTDASAWRALLHEEAPAFRLIRGDGIRLDRTGRWTLEGNPRVDTTFSNGIVVANSSWSAPIVERLDALTKASPQADPATWSRDVKSAWAARLAPRLLDTLDTPRSPSPAFEEALTYLLNWDFSYDRPSIGASVFEYWLQGYQSATGTLPLLPRSVPDSLIVRPDILTTSLIAAVDSLSKRYGNDLSQWRWERVEAARWRFPLWADATPSLDPLPARQRFTPIRLPGDGHPTTLSWGTSPVMRGPKGPASWTAWTSTAPWGRLVVQRRQFTPDQPLNRYLTEHSPPRPLVLNDQAPRTSTLLVPPPSE